MYGQGNYAQFGQRSQRPMPDFQQRPIASPHPYFQHGPPASQYPIIQQGPPSIPPHFTHAPPPPVQQGPPVQVATIGMLNAGQSFLPPTPPPPPPQQVHGSTSMGHPYPVNQQNSHWTHNRHHTLATVPPLGPPPSGPNWPEMFQRSLLPGALPTLPSEGQAPLKGPVYPPQPGGVQVSQQILPPPPPLPPISSFFPPAPSGSCEYPSLQDPDVPAAGPMPPPLPPSSPPPLPSSPLPTFGTVSSALLLTVAHLSHNSESGPMDHQPALEVMHSDSKVVVSSQIREDAPVLDNYEVPCMTSCEVGSPTEEDLSSVECSKLDLPSPPRKPAEQKVVQNIEVLCHLIAKNGPDFEDMARQKEYGNPEFNFFFGGNPGSEAAVAHEYFEWVKKKCKLQEKHNNSVWRPSGIDTSTRTSYLAGTGVSHSPPDSDMDIEGDIPPDEEQQICTSLESLNHVTMLVPKELDIREQLRAPVNANENSLVGNDVSASSKLDGQEEGSELFSDHDHFIDGRALAKVDSPVTNSYGASECPSKSNDEESSGSPLEDPSQQYKSVAAVGIDSGKLPGELIEGAIPFRLVQDDASDDSLEVDDKPRLEEPSPLKASPSTAADVSSLHGVIGSDLQTRSDVAYGMLESNAACSQRMPLNAVEFCPESQRTTMEISITSSGTIMTEEIFRNNRGNEGNIDNAAPLNALQQSVVLDGVHDSTPERGKSQSRKEDAKSASTLRKVDELGRLVREGASESDSDESHDTGRRGRRRRSWNRSPSCHSRRRSPWRRREKRSWSRSLSPQKRRSTPQKRRSRSRSPTYKRRGEYGGETMRRDKGQLPMCFDFLRGRCHRGATCRYMHHDSDKSDGSRRNRSKQQYAEIPHVSRASGFHEKSKKVLSERPVHEKKLDRHVDGDGEKELASMQDAVPSVIHDQDDKSLLVKLAKSEMSREVTAIMNKTHKKEEKLESIAGLPKNCLGELTAIEQEMQDIREQNLEFSTGLHDVENNLKQVETSHGIASLVENFVIPNSRAQLVKTSHSSSGSHSLQVQSSTSFHHGFPVSGPEIKQIPPVQSYPGTSSVTHSVSSGSMPPIEDTIPVVITAVNIPDYHLELPTSRALLSQGTSIPTPTPHLPREHGLMQPASKFPPLYSHSVAPPNSSWSLQPPPPPLPPPPPFVNNTNPNAIQGFPSLQFHHAQPPSRSDFNSQMFARPYSLSTGFVGEGHFSQLPVQGLYPPNLYGQGSISLQLAPPLRMQSFPGDNLPSGGFFTSSSQNHPCSQQLQPLHGLWQSSTNSLTVNRGDHENVIPTMSRFASGLDKNQPSHPSDSGGSRISNYCNPYVSTFVQPLSSKFSSNVIKQEKDEVHSNQLGSKFSSNVIKQENNVLHNNQHGVGSIVSELVTFSPKPEPDGLLSLCSDQYDPLFDSIDPSANSFMKVEHCLKHEPIDDTIILRLKSSHKPLDVEASRQKDRVLAETLSIKSENDENGETADAEVGDVENASGSNALDATNTSAGEVEINQVKTPGKRKKSKDSASMKLFKVALADFVKEVLKPSWRQGNMSKEAFKTIVKKTVDKVFGAMENHQIPKSQAKINQYIDSSQRKLTKLVMGYVQKYVEV